MSITLWQSILDINLDCRGRRITASSASFISSNNVQAIKSRIIGDVRSSISSTTSGWLNLQRVVMEATSQTETSFCPLLHNLKYDYMLILEKIDPWKVMTCLHGPKLVN